MKILRKHPLFFIFLLGIVIRLSLLFVDFSFDVNNHIIWAKDLHTLGSMGFFDKQSTEVYATLYPNYPPLSLFLFYSVYPLQKVIIDISWWLNLHIPLFPSNIMFFVESRAFFAGMMKLPAVLFDLGTAWIVFLYAKKLIPNKPQQHFLAPLLILLNPVFFYNSAFWGQIDVIPIFFLLASYYVLQFTDRSIVSAVLFTLGLLVKPTILIFFPVYLIFFFNKFGWKHLIMACVVANVVFLAAFIPFVKFSNIFSAYDLFQYKILDAQSLPYVTNGAFNMWAIMTKFVGIKDTAPFLLGISYRLWGYCIAGILSIAVVVSGLKQKNKRDGLLTISFLVGLICVLFLTKMHERYFMLPLPFLLLIAIKNKAYMTWFLLLSLLSFLNLYHSWAVPFIKPLFDVISSQAGYSIIAGLNIAILFFASQKLLYHPHGE